MVEWQLLNMQNEWEEQPGIAGVMPSAASYQKAVLLINNQIFLRLVSLKDEMGMFWAVGV